MEKEKITPKQYQSALKIVKKYLGQLEQHYKEVQNDAQNVSFYDEKTYLGDLPLSIQLYGILKANQEKLGITLYPSARPLSLVGDLAHVSVKTFRSCRQAGLKRVEELKGLAWGAGITLRP